MTSTADEHELIRQARQGSARAWEELVRRHEGRVYNQGLRLTGDPAEALDLMQEVFIGVYRNLYRFRGEARFSSWLFRIAHNKAVDFNRRRRLLPLRAVPSAGGDGEELQDYANVADEREPGPQTLALTDESNRRIASLMAGLPGEQRLMVELKVFQSLTFEEIARMQEIPVNTAKTRFYTALRRLKSRMEPDHELSEDA